MKNFDYEKVSITSAVNACTDAIPAVPNQNWQLLRGASLSSGNIHAETRAWLSTLPVEVRPNWLVKKYPRIANKLADVWLRPAACRMYLDELAFDTRGERTGFPTSVALEIATLKNVFDSMQLVRTDDIWSDGA